MKINEYVGHSWFKSESGLHPWDGNTEPDPDKQDAYSFAKAPRYDDSVMEVGPLARTVVSYMSGKNDLVKNIVDSTCASVGIQVSDLFSVLGRHAARALETKMVADRCAEWALQLKPGQPVATPFTIEDSVIDNYQVVAPTTWNVSPRDDQGQLGAIEQALIGTPVADVENPIEPGRVVRSFDP
jgi:Ni,Fe-hydrogenase I large subunit